MAIPVARTSHSRIVWVESRTQANEYHDRTCGLLIPTECRVGRRRALISELSVIRVSPRICRATGTLCGGPTSQRWHAVPDDQGVITHNFFHAAEVERLTGASNHEAA